MQDGNVKLGAAIALVAAFALAPGQVAFAGSDHGVRVHRLMKPSPKPKPLETAKVKTPTHTLENDFVFIPDAGPYRRRYTPDRRPWSERRSAFIHDSQRAFQNPPGLYSSQLNRAFD